MHFYRSYEPNWLAKITDPSYRFQLLVDETIDSYLEKNNVRCIKGTWCDPGINTDYCLFVKSSEWTEDEKQTFKRGLENTLTDIWGYGRYSNYWMQDSHHLYLNTKYGQNNWQWHFVNSIIKSDRCCTVFTFNSKGVATSEFTVAANYFHFTHFSHAV